ncbi:MAG TPA: sensor histidine kinase [Thermodesulfovibrionia bacterium]|nr:sensor histidine kinase [Thermodesulfovibrionia bacterium]
MLNELITNILKYAFGEGKDGEIFISLHIIDKKTIELRVQDNGMGIPDDFDIDKTETLDFKIVKIIGNKQLRGTVECRKLQPGTEVIIRFRNPKNE